VSNEDFTVTGPDKKWGADISYVWSREGWLYLAVVIDLFARRVVRRHGILISMQGKLLR
jgi:putative transposase